MKYREIELKDIKRNIKRNKKGMIFIFLCIFLFGSIWAYADRFFYKQEVFTPEDTIVQKVDYSYLEKDETYYYYAFMEVKEKVCALNAYIQYLGQVNLSEKSVEKVLELEDFAIESQRVFGQIREYYIGSKPIICNNLEEAEEFIIGKIETSRLKLQEAEQTLEDLGEKAGGKERRSKLNAMKDVKIWEDYLAMMNDIDLDKIQQVNSRMDQLLEKGRESINGVVEKFNALIKDIENEEQYDIIYNRYLLSRYREGVAGEFVEEDDINLKKEEALIYARSIANLDSREERFLAKIMFFILLGTTLSLLYGCLKNFENRSF